MAQEEHIFSADSSVKDFESVRIAVGAMFSGFAKSRYAGWRIFIKDVRAEYANSAMGVFWDFMDPLVLGLIFYFLRRSGVVSIGEIAIPYSVFIIYGMLLYQTFAESVTIPLTLMGRSKNLLSNVRVPPEALVLSAVYRLLFNSAFRILVMLAFSLFTGAFSLPGFAGFLLIYPSIIIVGMAFGLVLAPFNVIYSDVGRLVRVILNPLRYATPVLYPIASSPPFNYIYMFNPMALVLDELRSLATQGTMEEPLGFAVRVAFFAVVTFLGCFLFHISVPVLAARA